MTTATRPAAGPPAAIPPRLPLGPESWAFKYGKLAKGQFGYDKSGFSPTEYPALSFPKAEDARIAAIESFQRDKMHGFTARELGQLDCLPTRELGPGNLQNDIIPLLRRDRWETAPAQPDLTRDHMYPLANGKGIWSGDNDEVWNVLEPICKLASRMLMSIHVVPWFDALLNSPRRRVPDNRLHFEDQGETGLEYIDMASFTPSGNDNLARQRELAFEKLRTTFRYQLGFMISSESPVGPEQDAEDALALTLENHAYMIYDPETNKSWRSFTFLNISQLELLMRDGFNTAERIMLQWSVANTIVHEVMHAIGTLQTSLIGLYDVAEPFFGDQALSEIGYGFELLMNSGIPDPILYDDDAPSGPLGYFLQRVWPSYADAYSRTPDTPILKDPGPHTYNEFFPIPISFYQDIQQEDFWAVVRQYGNHVFHFRALKEGTRVQYTVTDAVEGWYKSTPRTRFKETDPAKILNAQFRASVLGLGAAINLTPQEREALKFGLALVNSADAQEQFWDQSVEQGNAVQSVRDIMRFAASNPGDSQIYETIFNLIAQAITHHGKMIINLKSQEDANCTVYTDRRKSLLTWNQETRSFIRQLIRMGVQGTFDIVKEELRLEQCRMYLWNPNTISTQSGQNFLEIQILQAAREAMAKDDKDLCRTYCNRLIAEDWRSLFGECSARALLFALDKDVNNGYSGRLAELQSVAKIVAKVLDNAPPFWKNEVAAWQTDVQLLLRVMPVQESQPTVPNSQGNSSGMPVAEGNQRISTVVPQIHDRSRVADTDAMEE